MIEVYKKHKDAILPTRSHKTDAGWDLYLLEDTFIAVMSNKVLSTGICVNIPECNFGKIHDRSSLAKDGLQVGGGVIDSGYNGEILVVMHNLTNQGSYNSGEYGKWLRKGDRIAQIIISPINTTETREVMYLWSSPRDSSGFGSSGV